LKRTSYEDLLWQSYEHIFTVNQEIKLPKSCDIYMAWHDTAQLKGSHVT